MISAVKIRTVMMIDGNNSNIIIISLPLLLSLALVLALALITTMIMILITVMTIATITLTIMINNTLVDYGDIIFIVTFFLYIFSVTFTTAQKHTIPTILVKLKLRKTNVNKTNFQSKFYWQSTCYFAFFSLSFLFVFLFIWSRILP